MGKKQMARKTPPKKNGKGTEPIQKGKEKVKGRVSFKDPVEDDESEEVSGEEEEEESGEEEVEESEEVSGEEQEEESGGEEEKQASGDEADASDINLADVLNKVVKMAAALGAKKKGKKPATTVDDSDVQPEPLKVDKVKQTVGQSSKEMKVGQSSKRKINEGAVVPDKAKRRRKEGVKLKAVEGHGSPASLYDAIMHLSSAQKGDVQNIGFGGLLELKANRFIHSMIDWLLDRYDTHTRLFLFNRNVHFTVCRYDVFMLPCSGEDVPTGEDKKLVASWRCKFGAKKDISLDKVKDQMLQLVDSGPLFKQLFVLFSMGSFLAPIVHNRMDIRLIRVVEDVEAIPRMNWCEYVLDRFDYSVNSWKGNETKSMGGCLMFFQVIYFHRCIWRRLPEKSTLPLIKHWDYGLMKARVNAECKAYTVHRGFSIGVWDLNTYPVSLHKAKSFYRLAAVTEGAEKEVEVQESAGKPEEVVVAQRDVVHESAAQPEEMVVAQPDVVKEQQASEPDSRCLSFPLPDDLPTDAELREIYKDERALKWHTLIRNQKLVSHLHHQIFAELHAPIITEDAPLEQVGEGGEAISQETFTQKMDNDPEFLADLLAMVEQTDALVEKVVQAPSFDLGIEDIDIRQPANPAAAAAEQVGQVTEVAPAVPKVLRLRITKPRQPAAAPQNVSRSGRPLKPSKKT